MSDPFGPQGGHAALTMPSGNDVTRYGATTWVKDCSAPGLFDGTVLDAAFYNNLIGNLRGVVAAGGLQPQRRGDMNLLANSIFAMIAGLGAGGGLITGANKKLSLAIGLGVLERMTAAIAQPNVDVVQVYDVSTKLPAEITMQDLVYATLIAINGLSITKTSDGLVTLSVVGQTPATRNVLTQGLATGGGNLSADRTINVPAAANADALTGSRTDVAMTPASTKAVTDALYAKLLGASPETLTTFEQIRQEFANDESAVSALTTVVGTKAASSRQVLAGTGLLGGGDLTADRTFTLDTGFGDSRYMTLSTTQTIPGNKSFSGQFAVNGTNAGIELGSMTAGSLAYIDFHSSASANDYDVRLIAIGGTAGTVGAGTMQYLGSVWDFGYAQVKNAAIVSGSLDNAPIGQTTPAPAKVTVLQTAGTGQGTYLHQAPQYCWYKDGGYVYLMLTGSDNPSAPFNGFRPFYVSFVTGKVMMGNGLSVTGGATIDTLALTTGLANLNLATMPALTVKANITGAAATPIDSSLSSILDASFSATRGAVLVRGSAGWSAQVPTTSGYTLQYNGTDTVFAASSPGTGGLRYDTAQALSAAQTSQALANAGAAPLSGYGQRNLLINGAHDVDVVNVGAAYTLGVFSGLTNYVTDQWVAWLAAAGTGITAQRVTQNANGVANVLRIARANGSTTTSGINVAQICESSQGIHTQGQVVTVSCKLKAGANFSPASVTAALITGTGIDQSSSAFAGGTWTGQATAASAIFNPTTTMQTFTFQAAIPAAATQIGLKFSFTPTGTAGAADTLDITDCQIELGAIAPAQIQYERRPYGTVARECLRFYETSWEGYAVGTLGSSAYGNMYAGISLNSSTFDDTGKVSFSAAKRAIPVGTATSPSTGAVNLYNASSGADQGSAAITNYSTKGFRISCGNNAMTSSNLFYAHWIANARL